MQYFILNKFLKFQNCVGKNEFKQCKYPTIRTKNSLYKYVGFTRKEALKFINEFRAESFDPEFFNLFNSFKSRVNKVAGDFSEFYSLIEMVLGFVNNAKEFAGKVEKYLILEIVQLFIKLADCIRDKITFLGLADVLIRIYKIWTMADDAKLFKSEGLTDLLTMSVASILPDKLLNVFKKASVLSNSKFFDDASLFFELFDTIMEYLVILLDMFPSSFTCKAKEILNTFVVGSKFIVLNKIKTLLKKNKDPKFICDESNRNAVKELDSLVQENVSLSEWKRRSNAVLELLNNFERLVRVVKMYESSSRIEPSCFMFEGPPGCLKSVTMNRIIQLFSTTSYCHVTKSVMDGKDWFDCYNGEKIFYQDDIGQHGPSQFRNLFNIVSPVKMPLDCADAKLKDTKYFSSEIVLMTTNRFMKLNGITKTDCIENPEALWRRCNVFDFSKVIRTGGKISGSISFYHYDIKKNAFVNDFPSDAKGVLNLRPTVVLDDSNLYLKWMYTIINEITELKKNQNVDNNLSKNDLDSIRNMSLAELYLKESTYQAESLEEYFSWFKDICWSIVQSFMDFDYKSFFLSQGFITGVLMYLLLMVPIWLFGNASDQFDGEYLHLIENNISKERAPSTLSYIGEGVHHVNVHNPSSNVTMFALCSGHYVILPAHALETEHAFISIFHPSSVTNKIYDHVPVKSIYRCNSEDVCILELPKTIHSPFKSMLHHIKDTTTSTHELYLCTFKGIIDLKKRVRNSSDFSIRTYTCDQTKFNGVLKLEDVFYDDIHSEGLCGNVLADPLEGILGMHVAGNKAAVVGAGKLWSNRVKQIIKDVLRQDSVYCINLSGKDLGEISGMKVNENLHVQSPKKTNIVESPLHGVFPIQRTPANPVIFGNHTVKDIEKKSFKLVKDLDHDELEFAKLVANSLIEDFDDISMTEVIKGNEHLAGLNKDSSNGYGYPGGKVVYVDYDNGCLTQEGQLKYDNFVNKVNTGIVNIEDNVWISVPKDELRDERKKGVPRTFRVSNLSVQISTKMLTGNMVKQIMSNKWFNQISVGVNPYADWQRIYDSLIDCKIVWDGDIGNYDGNMLPQLQFMLSEIIIKHYKGSQGKLLRYLLENSIYTPIAMNDDVYITTHSLPSGSFLTAIFNSLINKCYTAMWYYRNIKSIKKPTVSGFWKDVVDFVYGDDKLNGVFGYESVLNAITMRDFFLSLGMEYTDAKKEEISQSSSNMEEVSFLKRKFKFHNEIGRVMCPLDLKTLTSGMSWIDKRKETNKTMEDKISCFQREIYLHQDDAMIKELEEECLKRNFPFKILPKSYLKNLFVNNPEELEWFVGSNKYQ